MYTVNCKPFPIQSESRTEVSLFINQSKYPWAQCFTSIALLKKVKGRWTCIPLIHRFYLPKNALDSACENMAVNGKIPMFRSKPEQAVEMLVTLSEYFSGTSMLAVCDSWFGNNGLFAPARKLIGKTFHILSRLRSNIVLYAMPCRQLKRLTILE